MSSKSSSRREFLLTSFTMTSAALLWHPVFAASTKQPLAATTKQPVQFHGWDAFHHIRDKAVANGWCTLPIGELVGNIANEFLGAPYKAHTLELSTDREICSVDVTAFDCVTFFETSLAFARMLKKGGLSPKSLLDEIAFIRYRGGKPGDYSTRLHYTTDWFADNETKHVVKVLSELPGSKTITHRVGYMSAHPQESPQLVANPSLIPKIKSSEDAINKRSMKFVPMDKIAAIEPQLKTGDIVAICTRRRGLDVVHTGLVMRTADGVAHFMDASSKKNKMKVVLEAGPISQTLKWSKPNTGSKHKTGSKHNNGSKYNNGSPYDTGAIFARPLEPLV